MNTLHSTVVDEAKPQYTDIWLEDREVIIDSCWIVTAPSMMLTVTPMSQD